MDVLAGCAVSLRRCDRTGYSQPRVQWLAERMERIADTTSVCCRVTGIPAEAARDDGVEVLRPYIEHVLSVFGANPLMWDSDWPVLNLTSDCVTWHIMVKESVLDLLLLE